MRQRLLLLALALLCGLASPVKAQGVIPIALQQVISSNGQPLSGALLFIYQAGTVATPQNAFSDPGLTIPLSNPLVADSTGRLPMFYLANGSVHVRLTDSGGVVIFDYPSMLVIGASGGTTSGGSVDPTTIASTGDVKFRPTGESLAGWVKMNAQTIGSAASGASGRASVDTQNLFVYLWNNCPNVHCPVSSGRGVNALADFNANKTIQLPDWRGRIPVGLDDMGNIAAGAFTGVPFAGGDTATTPGALGGENTHTLTAAEIPPHTHAITDPGHTHGSSPNISAAQTNSNARNADGGQGSNGTASINPAFTGISVNQAGGVNPPGGLAHNDMQSFALGTWFMKL